jgi:hypothetical protein
MNGIRLKRKIIAGNKEINRLNATDEALRVTDLSKIPLKKNEPTAYRDNPLKPGIIILPKNDFNSKSNLPRIFILYLFTLAILLLNLSLDF